MSFESESTDRPKSTRRLLVSFLVPLVVLFVALVAALLFRDGNRQSALSTGPRGGGIEGLNVRLVRDKLSASAISEAQRAIIYADAPYSVDALKNGQRFLRGMLYVSQQTPAVNAEVFWIEDDSQDWCKAWIIGLGVDGLREVAISR
jgi:hypothetical protein